MIKIPLEVQIQILALLFPVLLLSLQQRSVSFPAPLSRVHHTAANNIIDVYLLAFAAPT
jgi:hypothetical protein